MDRGDQNRGRQCGLDQRQEDGEAKQHAAPGVISDRLRPRDKCGDGVIEAKHADLADKVSHRPGNRERAEDRGSQQPCHQKCEDAAEVRCEERNRVDQGAAF